MITVYPAGANDFKDGALAVIFPTDCTITKTAAAEWSLHLEMPVDYSDVRWKAIQPMNIIKAPIPPETLPAISEGDNVITVDSYDWYKLTTAGYRYSNTGGIGQKPVTYNDFKANKYYHQGDKVTHGEQNYEATASFLVFAFDQGAWKAISNFQTYTINPTRADSTMTAVNTDIKVTSVVTTAGTEYIYGTTFNVDNPVTGYWEKAKATFVETIPAGSSTTGEDIEARTIREQCFRIKSVGNDGKTITAECMHLSYDYAGMPVYQACKVVNATVPEAVNAILTNRSNMGINNHRANNKPLIACQSTGTTVTADYTGQNLIHCILDPDEGLVSLSGAKLLRDNWDFYLLQNTSTDRGFHIDYAVNMTGVDWTVDCSELITGVVPTGKLANGEPLYLETATVDSPRLSLFPFRINEMLNTNYKVGTDGTVEEVRAKMLADAQKRFSHDHVDQYRESVRVEFVWLGETVGRRSQGKLQGSAFTTPSMSRTLILGWRLICRSRGMNGTPCGSA